MTARPTINTITSDELDALHDQAARAGHLEAAIERVQQACHNLPHEHARRILSALDGGEPQP